MDRIGDRALFAEAQDAFFVFTRGVCLGYCTSSKSPRVHQSSGRGPCYYAWLLGKLRDSSWVVVAHQCRANEVATQLRTRHVGVDK